MEQGQINSDIDNAIASLRNRLLILESQAQEMCQQHFVYVMAQNKFRTWAERSVLYAQARMRDNTLTVFWSEVKWYGSKEAKTRRMEKKLIRKPKDKHGYNLPILLRKAQYWEEEMVREIEQEFFKIRHEVSFISKSLGLLNRVVKIDLTRQ